MEATSLLSKNSPSMKSRLAPELYSDGEGIPLISTSLPLDEEPVAAELSVLRATATAVVAVVTTGSR